MPKRPAAARVRDARASDMLPCARVFISALNDMLRRHGEPARKRDAKAVARRLAYLRSTDPRGFQVAARGDRVEAFASTILREDVHFLSMFWARPSAQGKGLGRKVLWRAFNRPNPPPTAVRCVYASLDYRAQALYLKMGMVPRGFVYGLAREGPPRKVAPPEFPVELVQIGDPGEPTKGALALAAAIDRRVRGCRRDTDIAFTMAEEGSRFFEAREGGDAVGYVILQKKGAVGPGGVIDPRYTEGLAWAGLQAQRDLGAARPYVQVLGHNEGALRAAFAAGLKIDSPGAWMAQREFGKFDRYFAMSGDLF